MVAWPRISVLVTIRYDWALPSKPSRSRSRCRARWSSTRSPRWPNGGWPRSCARAAASTTSGSQPPSFSSRSAWPPAEPLGDRPAHLGDLQAVREPVVHQQAGAARADHLGDAAQPGEERRADDPVAVDPERAGRQVARRDQTVAEEALRRADRPCRRRLPVGPTPIDAEVKLRRQWRDPCAGRPDLADGEARDVPGHWWLWRWVPRWRGRRGHPKQIGARAKGAGWPGWQASRSSPTASSTTPCRPARSPGPPCRGSSPRP